jgi:transcriptional regulator with XRE-family HTH domain
MTGAGKVIRQIRKRLAISQEVFSRMLGATKGAVQHWERGRNNPDLARLVALRRVCPPGPEQRELDQLLERVQNKVAPEGDRGNHILMRLESRSRIPKESPDEIAHRREHQRLERQVERLMERLIAEERRVKTLENQVNELRREFEFRNSATPRGPASVESSE